VSLALLVVLLVLLILIDVPIAIALGAIAALAIGSAGGLTSLPNTALIMFDGATKFPLIAIPLFVFAGALMNASGISQRLIALASAVIGFVRGGMAMVTIAASLFFAEISGSAVADVAALGSILIPAMRNRGYPNTFAAAVMSSSATLAVVIPPSIPMILYAVMSGSSVVELFVAGIVPGVLGGLGLMAVTYATARRHGYPVEQAFQLGKVATAFREAAWALALPGVILGGIFSGWVTATEGAGLAVVAALLIGGFVYRGLTRARIFEAAREAGVQTAVVMLLVAASALLGDFLTEVRLPQQMAASIGAYADRPFLVLLLLNAFFLIVGLFLHSAAAIVLVVPIVMPLVREVGIDPVHFGLIVTLNLGIGQQTPPVASVLATACSLAGADIWQVSRVNLRFIAVLLVVLLLVTYVPALAMWPVTYFYR